MSQPQNEAAAEANQQEPPLPWLEEMAPRQIVAELDRYIVGQEAAKRAIAIAVRNRWRRGQAPEGIRDEITPSNLILIGPTGVGKTEIARRLARLAGAPFIKVEASKFTEVGYVGRDVESVIRDLVDAAINLVRTEREDEVYDQAEQKADDRILELLLPAAPPPIKPESVSPPADLPGVFVVSPGGAVSKEAVEEDSSRRSRSKEKLRQLLADGKLDDREVEIEVQAQSFPPMDFMPQPPQGMEGADFNWGEWLQEMMPKRKKRRTVRVPEARRILLVLDGQRAPQLQAVAAPRHAVQVVGRALGVHDAAAGRHPVNRAGLDALHHAGGVAVQHRALEQVGHRGQPDVRVGPHIVVVRGLRGDRPEVVEEQERPDRLALHRRQRAPNQKAAAEVLDVGLDTGRGWK